MKSAQLRFSLTDNLPTTNIDFGLKPSLIFVFASADFFKEPALLDKLSYDFPDAEIIGCSTEGQIISNEVLRSEMIATAVEFRTTKLESHAVEVISTKNHYEKGLELASLFNKEGLKHIFLLSVSLATYGDDFLQGIRDGLPQEVKVTGGLASDTKKYGDDFVLDKNNKPNPTMVKAIGFYGESLAITYASVGGWQETPVRLRATHSTKNVLEKINNKPALDVYMEVLNLSDEEVGESSIKFPFNVYQIGEETPVIRTVIGVDKENRTITFGGNIEEGSTLKVMKASVERIIEGAGEAAQESKTAIPEGYEIKLALIVSCNGRKFFLENYVTEEIERVIEETGPDVIYTGFYSRGEIAPFKQDQNARLHNQTMTVTMFSEAEIHESTPEIEEKKGFFKRLFG